METTLAQIVADELGVNLEDITIIHGDSAAVPHSTGTYASRSGVLGAGAGALSARGRPRKIGSRLRQSYSKLGWMTLKLRKERCRYAAPTPR